MSAAVKCALGAKHKWEWLKDVTNMTATITREGAVRKLSRRGIYKCASGAERQGSARSGL
ncbi:MULTISPECIES: hypothetical protein [unclassified Janthinobacterium]|uniref:hypothetical protein n=1 Tax=unclassified Janthinobacterium TaxID=2610881 RepID=UPI00160BF6A8|nr:MULTISPECIES: hypothetical protein [unclassified Janthinobacterium]MBB5610385.1 hypothetical protein [Janthinobacterium sp. S3T4]MBB5615778.1 hypothetical protein [Janthinobacterium sp. S3M3]